MNILKEINRVDDLRRIAKILRSVDARTQINRNDPGAIERFKALVAQGDEDQIAKYFQQYGIDPVLAKSSLPELIEEELRDLAG